MKYNKTQRRFDLGLGLNFRIVEDDTQPLLRIKSNIPELNYLTNTTELSIALNDILGKVYALINLGLVNYKDCREFIKQNNIKELL